MKLTTWSHLSLNAIKRHQSKKCIGFNEMIEEIKMIEKNNTWKLVDFSQGKGVK